MDAPEDTTLRLIALLCPTLSPLWRCRTGLPASHCSFFQTLLQKKRQELCTTAFLAPSKNQTTTLQEGTAQDLYTCNERARNSVVPPIASLPSLIPIGGHAPNRP